jgi:hypothetical protein
VRVYKIPVLYPFYQQTTPYYLASNAAYTTNGQGNVTYAPGTLIVNGTTQGIQLSGDFYGTTADGIPYTTDVYRMSSNSNVFNFLFSVTGNSSPTLDIATDQSIAANQQLTLNRDAPPTGITDIGQTGTPTYNPNPIEVLLDRTWSRTLIPTRYRRHSFGIAK